MGDPGHRGVPILGYTACGPFANIARPQRSWTPVIAGLTGTSDAQGPDYVNGREGLKAGHRAANRPHLTVSSTTLFRAKVRGALEGFGMFPGRPA